MRYIAEDDNIEFVVSMPDQGWFGLVIDEGGMARGSDMIVFHADGEDSYVGDYHSTGYAPPAEDDNNDLSAQSIDEKDGNVIFIVTRLRKTDDAEDTEIPLEKNFTLGYAYNSRTSRLGYLGKHSTASSMETYLAEDGTPAIVPSPNSDDSGATTITTGVVSMVTAVVLALF